MFSAADSRTGKVHDVIKTGQQEILALAMPVIQKMEFIADFDELKNIKKAPNSIRSLFQETEKWNQRDRLVFYRKMKRSIKML